MIRTIESNGGGVALKERTVWRQFPCGEEIVEETVDPDGTALATHTAYFENEGDNGYARIASVTRPDGSWVRYAYDGEGRKVKEIATLLDGGAGSAEGASRVTAFDYAPQAGYDSDAPEDAGRPRKITVSEGGTPVSATYRVYHVDPSTGERTEIVEKCAVPGAAYGAPANLRTLTVTLPSGGELAGAGRVREIQHPDGRMETHAHEYGIYTPPALGNAPGTFTPEPARTFARP